MKRVKEMSFILVLAFIAGCTSQNNRQSISDAYEVVEKLSEESTEEPEKAIESTIASETGGEKVSDQGTIPTFANELPPRTLTVDAEFVESDAEVLCNGFKFKVENSVMTDSMEELNDVLEEFFGADGEIEVFKQQLTDCGVVVSEDGTIPRGLLLVQCRFEYTGSSEKYLQMAMPVYEITVGIDELKVLASKNKVTMEELSYVGGAKDFYGEHNTYVDPNIGVLTSTSLQYHLFQPGETFETIFIMDIAANGGKVTGELCLSSGYLLNESNMNFGAGTHIIPLDVR